MATQQVVQELKAERVQEELMAATGEPCWLWLKAERVQEPGLAAAGAEGKPSSLKLALSQQQKVSIELHALQVVVTLHGQAGHDPATSPGQGVERRGIMPSINSKADVIVHLRGLLDAGARSPELQQGIETERQSLEQSVTEIETLKGRQDELKGLRQENTQQLGAAIRRGKEAGIRYQSVVRAKLGPHNERLVQFNMAPIRRRPRKPLVVVVEKSPDGETLGTEPGTSVSPPAKPVV